MKKLLFVPDNHSPHSGAIDFTYYMRHLTQSELTGVFLENLKLKELMAPTMGKESMHERIPESRFADALT
jgi:hypothetical protein